MILLLLVLNNPMFSVSLLLSQWVSLSWWVVSNLLLLELLEFHPVRAELSTVATLDFLVGSLQ